MHLLLSFAGGRLVEAFVLSASVDRMRISMPGYEDALELRNEQGIWTLERGERVEIESIVVTTGSSTIIPEVRPLTHRAGGPAIS